MTVNIFLTLFYIDTDFGAHTDAWNGGIMYCTFSGLSDRLATAAEALSIHH